MPQATIRLQSAPAPAAIRKPTASYLHSKTASSGEDKAGESDEAAPEAEELESGATVSEIPLPVALASVILALAALAIQIWTFLA